MMRRKQGRKKRNSRNTWISLLEQWKCLAMISAKHSITMMSWRHSLDTYFRVLSIKRRPNSKKNLVVTQIAATAIADQASKTFLIKHRKEATKITTKIARGTKANTLVISVRKSFLKENLRIERIYCLEALRKSSGN